MANRPENGPDDVWYPVASEQLGHPFAILTMRTGDADAARLASEGVYALWRQEQVKTRAAAGLSETAVVNQSMGAQWKRSDRVRPDVSTLEGSQLDRQRQVWCLHSVLHL